VRGIVRFRVMEAGLVRRARGSATIPAADKSRYSHGNEIAASP